MSRHRLPLLIGLLAVLLAVAWLSGAFQGNPSTLDVPDVDIPADRVTALRLSGATSLSLVREGTAWRIEEPVQAPADSATVAALLDALGSLELVALVSTSPDRYGRYGVDSTGSAVDVSWDGGAARIVVSTRGPDFQSSYVRVDGDPAVYATRSRVGIPADPSRWRDRRMLADAMPIGATVQTPDASYTVDPAPGGWTIAAEGGAPVPADSASVARWLGRFAGLMADGFMTDVSPDSVAAGATHAVVLRYPGAPDRSLRLMERDGAVAATLEAGGPVFRFFASRLVSLAPAAATLEAR